MKAKKSDGIIYRPQISLWSRTSYFITWYTAQFIISLIAFLLIGKNLRLVFRACDIITNENVWTSFDPIAIQLLIESIGILFSFFLCVRGCVLFYGVLLNLRRIKDADELLTSGGNSFGFEGEQGVGKTRTMVYASMILAEKRAESLCLKYYKTLPVRKQLEESERFWELRRFNAREEAYHFYFLKNKDKIPTLYGNVDITYNGLKPHTLTAKHFTQQERLYENNVKILTEADDLFPNTLRKKKKKKDEKPDPNEIDVNAVDKFVGLDRQYTNGTLISDTHANGDVFKAIRNCQSFTLYLTRSEYRYAPALLENILERINNKILSIGDNYKLIQCGEKAVKNPSRKMDALLRRLGKLRKRSKKVETLMRQISITRIYYHKISGTSEQKTVEKEEFFVLPNQVPYVYDDRMFQQDYAFAKNLKSTAEAVTSPTGTTTESKAKT